MQTANAIVNLAGDAGQQVPKTDLTPAEVAILLAIHGNDAVHSIEIGEDVERSNRTELDRLHGIYGQSKGEGQVPVMPQLFPGMGAKVPMTFADLELDDFLYKTPPVPAEAAPAPKAPKPAKGKAAKGKAAAAATDEEEDDTDGVEDMNDDSVLG